VSALGDDFYTFDQARQRFIGRKKKKTFKAGDELEVVVARVDPFKQQLDFAPV
jgi:ribonuclease R